MQSPSHEHTDSAKATCLIVGAGIAGLTAAHALIDAGFQVMVFDMGRGVGGRMATRRFGGGVFDHGAQFITVRDPRFLSWIEKWRQSGVVDVWAHGFIIQQGNQQGNGHPRYRGAPAMTAIPKALAQGVDVQLQTTIEAVNIVGDRWQLITDSHQQYEGDALILTPPVPQSLQLLDKGNVSLPPSIVSQLNEIVYHPCIALLAVFDAPTSLPHPGGMQFESGALRWIADNQQKGVSPDVTAVTIHAAPGYSVEQWSAPDVDIAQQLLAEAAAWLPASVRQYEVHRWRYSQPVNTEPVSNVVLSDPPLLFAGDAFAGGRVEGAVVSGWNAADWLISRLSC